MRHRWWLAGMLLLSFAALPATASAQQAQPDIIVVLLDDARAGDIERTMPRTQALLPDGTWFPNFIVTTSACCPSRATLLTGNYAHNHGVLDNTIDGKPGGWQTFRPHEASTLAVTLDAAGYQTALVAKYPNQYRRLETPPAGWDTWEADNGQPSYLSTHDPPRYLVDKRAGLAAEIAGSATDPLFLWYADAPPHDFLAEPPPVAERHRDAFPEISDPYERARLQSILAVDDGVAGIAAALGASRWDRACVVVLSDNGLMLGEHGYMSVKGVPYDEAVRVPMLLRCPGIEAGTDERLVASIDIAPTLAHAARTELGWDSDGRALQDTWQRDGVLMEWLGDDMTAEGVSLQNWTAVRTHSETYVEYADGTRVLWDRRLDDEEFNHLTEADTAVWSARLASLRDCAGAECRVADSWS